MPQTSISSATGILEDVYGWKVGVPQSDVPAIQNCDFPTILNITRFEGEGVGSPVSHKSFTLSQVRINQGASLN